jgi:hypothetical protein
MNYSLSGTLKIGNPLPFPLEKGANRNKNLIKRGLKIGFMVVQNSHKRSVISSPLFKDGATRNQRGVF